MTQEAPGATGTRLSSQHPEFESAGRPFARATPPRSPPLRDTFVKSIRRVGMTTIEALGCYPKRMPRD